ncbi:MAG: hypothetical protein CMJ45_12050 [Planctomyces sp.]|nr:hypothetical protein [Planctomyces sp.]
MDQKDSKSWRWVKDHWKRNPIGAGGLLIWLVVVFPFRLVGKAVAPPARLAGRNPQWATIAVTIIVVAVVVPLWLGGFLNFRQPTIRLVDGQWETLSINNAIAKFVIEKGYGYSVETVVTGDWRTDLSDGTVDATLEGWQQNYREWYNEATSKGKVDTLATIYENGPQFFVIPQWVADEYSIRTIFDMEKHWELFKGPEDGTRGVFHNCPPGGQCSEINPVKLEAYDLYKTYKVVDSDSYGRSKRL